jgi:hypothetical protein
MGVMYRSSLHAVTVMHAQAESNAPLCQLVTYGHAVPQHSVHTWSPLIMSTLKGGGLCSPFLPCSRPSSFRQLGRVLRGQVRESRMTSSDLR